MTAWSGIHNPSLKGVLDNHAAYAEKHSYKFLFLDDTKLRSVGSLAQNPQIDLTWIKVQAIQSALKNHDFVFWIDADSIFLDMNRSLSDLIDEPRDLVFTGDRNDVCNAGHLLLRNTSFSAELMRNWATLRSISFPPLNTSHQGKTGYVGDQVALNYLLAGGIASPTAVLETSEKLFNRMNGWKGNRDREIKSFRRTHAPVSESNLPRTAALLGPSIKHHVRIVPQPRINAYPWWGLARFAGNKPGPIVHFVPPWKKMISHCP